MSGMPELAGYAFARFAVVVTSEPAQEPNEDTSQESRFPVSGSGVTAWAAASRQASCEGRNQDVNHEATPARPRVAIGAPLPAHLLVLCGGSPRFRAQVQRWTRHQPPGSKPVLRVPLDGEDDMPYAMSALRFIYNNELSGADSIPALLRVRRQAAYLQVEGCMEACDVAVRERLVNMSGRHGSAGDLAGARQLFAARGLLPDPAEEPVALRCIMHTCRQQLMRHSSSGRIEGAVAEGAPSLGELLGWAFGDAPSVLSDPMVRGQMEQLSAAAMEALLGSSCFATDSESSVLLMLAVWLQANAAFSGDTCMRLCRLVRLSHLSSVYLHAILPTLAWVPISTEEHRFLCCYATAAAGLKARLLTEALRAGKYHIGSPWYAAAARPSSMGTPRKYQWHIDQEEVIKDTRWLIGKLVNGAADVVSMGFGWHPVVQELEAAAGVYLVCWLPSALRSSAARNVHVVAPGAARLSVLGMRSDGSRGEVWSQCFGDSYVAVGCGWGSDQALPLDKAAAGGAGGPANTLAAWSAFLHGGKLCGLLEWEAVATA